MKKKKIYLIVFMVSLVVLGLSLFGVVNTLVSLKYETDAPGQCISDVSGIDLCRMLFGTQVVAALAGLVTLVSVYLLLFREGKADAVAR